MLTRIIVVVLFVALLAVPFLLRQKQDPPPTDALRLIIITPHNEQIRTEFARAFDGWHERTQGRRVHVVWSVPGGTSEIRKMLQAQYAHALRTGDPLGGAADLAFGGGSYEHGKLKEGVAVTVDGEKLSASISMPVDFSREWLDEMYGENALFQTQRELGDSERIYDPDLHWFGTALSGFGIVYNRDALAQIQVDEPEYWADLCNPKLQGWVALVNPGQSGSITTAFEAILQRRGWDRGWRILRRAGANARYFSATSLKPPMDVSQGDAAMGVCIDFYGRYQSQAVRVAGGGDRVGYIDPPGVTTIDADPISMLRGAPHPELARRFIEFCLTEEGQSLWQFHVDDPVDDDLGPHQFELRRMPVRRVMYERYSDRMIDKVNPFELATEAEHADRNMRSFIAILFAAMTMDNHNHLINAWDSIVNHPAYPDEDGIVSASDVDDPQLARMLELFDAIPFVEGPGGEIYSLADSEGRAAVKAGWLKNGWEASDLWPREATPGDVLRRRFTVFFRENYEKIRRIAQDASAAASETAGK